MSLVIEMEKACFCFDIDGTLLTSDHAVAESTIEALRKLQKLGHKVIIATGRNYPSLLGTGILDLIDWDGIVMNNGQCAMDKDLNLIYLEKMDSQTVQEIIDVSNEHGLVCLLETVDRWFTIQDPNEYTRTAHDFFHEEHPQKEAYDPSMEIIMAIAYAPMGYDYAPYKRIKEINVDVGVSTYADLTKRGCHKYKGIEKFLDFYGIHQSVCFGDGSNDIEMIRHADIGIAMGQGVDELKEVSDFVTKSCDEDGIAYAIQYFGYLE